MDANDYDSLAGEVFAFRHSLNVETDRGCAMMVAAYLDNELGRLLRSRLVESRGVLDKLLSTQGGPLGTFSARIDMTYALGLIGPNSRRDLHLIRKIRNDFGHRPEVIQFADPAFRSRCNELYHAIAVTDKPRQWFTTAAIRLLSTIQFQIFRSSHISEENDSGDDDAMISGLAEFMSEVMEEADKNPDITAQEFIAIFSSKVAEKRTDFIRAIESLDD